MAISSNSANMNLQKLADAIKEIDGLLEEERARKAKNDRKLSPKAQKEMGEYKTAREIKLEHARKVYEAAQNKLNSYIHTLENTYVPNADPNAPKQTYMEALAGKDTRATLTLARIGEVVGNPNGVDLTALKAEDQALMQDVSSGYIYDEEVISVQRNMFDRVKDLGDDVVNCKGKVLTLAKGCLIFGLLEGITRGISHQLVAKLAVPTTFGLLDVVNYGLCNIPSITSMISSGAAMAWGFSPFMLTAFGAFAVLKGIPLAKKAIKWGKEKFNATFLADHNFAKEIAQPAS